MKALAQFTVGAAAVFLGLQISHAEGRYVSLGIGYGGEEFNAATTGVNHPTRCDRLLYANPQDAPSDAACRETTPRRIFGGTFDLGGAFVVSASIGQAWTRWRIEAELLGRSHSGASAPAIPGADNTAILGKQSEWSAHSPPRYEVDNFSTYQLFVNAHYLLARASKWTPYVGAGVGVARIAADYTGTYLRRTVAEGYVAATGGDPAQPADWQLAAAGSVSILDIEVTEYALGYQFFAGVDHALTERTALFAMARWSAFADVESDDVWTTIRSHAPMQADGVTPFTTEQTLEDLGGATVTVGFRYTFP